MCQDESVSAAGAPENEIRVFYFSRKNLIALL